MDDSSFFLLSILFLRKFIIGLLRFGKRLKRLLILLLFLDLGKIGSINEILIFRSSTKTASRLSAKMSVKHSGQKPQCQILSLIKHIYQHTANQLHKEYSP